MDPVATWSFRVEGELKPKGSVDSFAYREKGTKRLRTVVTHKRETKASEQAVKVAATEQLRARDDYARAAELFHGRPVRLIVVCRYAPPKWVEKRRQPGRDRPALEPLRTTVPDTDKLLRTVGDALKGVAYRDDAQVFDGRVVKAYARGQPPHAVVWVSYFEKEYPPDQLAPELL